MHAHRGDAIDQDREAKEQAEKFIQEQTPEKVKVQASFGKPFVKQVRVNNGKVD